MCVFGVKSPNTALLINYVTEESIETKLLKLDFSQTIAEIFIKRTET